jgi:predicted restriction endonuclease
LEEKFAKRKFVYIHNEVLQWIRNDRPIIRALKAKYGYRCQFPECKATIPLRNGHFYCEVAHIRPVAKGGHSVRINLLVLCPNHHKMFDYGDLAIEVNTRTTISGKLNGKPFTIHR